MSETNFFNRIEQFTEKKTPFVYYRKPGEEEVFALIQKDDSIHLCPDLSENGFVFSPFEGKEKKIIFPFEHCERLKYNYHQEGEDNQEVGDEKSYDLQNKFDKEKHIRLIEKGLEIIGKGEVSKVVLSRKEEVVFPGIKLSKIYKNLLNRYPDSFVYLWFHPELGLWMGATPETLLKVKKGEFKTMALAGTRPFEGKVEVQWNEKEREEQQFVTDFILSKLDKDEVTYGKPYTRRAGSLLHICTDIKGRISKKNTIRNLVNILHPTPAVCGVPKEKAFEFIIKNEDYNRTYYTGFLGVINNGSDEDADLYVNLRCMQIDLKEKNKAVIYVGGGITSGSIPQKEWEETVDKSKVMKSVLF
ncbi:MAG: isochorismate synthase [Flavobacteriia bacterium]|nr:MAG: isochorismate synthase [Flavobacteriia bacterium]